MVIIDAFEKYFESADLDKNGRISISEAISFFQMFGLPNSDLAKIWQYVDQEERGFLERMEFYNALKLVTLAQRGLSITPHIVISELFGPNGSKIPAPMIPSQSAELSSDIEEERSNEKEETPHWEKSILEADWPMISEKEIGVYTDIFEKIDKDRDGLITSEQANTLFLSWKLPIEVINQVINLSDSDKDGILSLREFCISVYLLAQHREGYIIPNILPNSILFDKNLIRATGLPSSCSSNPNNHKYDSGLSNWDSEHIVSRQATYPSLGTRRTNEHASTSLNRVSSYNFDKNPSYGYETLNAGPIRYPTIPTAPIEPLYAGLIRYPSIDLTRVESEESISKEADSSTGTGDSVIVRTGEEESNNNDKECVICCERQKNSACIPCGHVATCYECLEMIRKAKGECPICRGDINQVVRIYNA